MASPAADRLLKLHINKLGVIKSTSKDADLQAIASALSEALEWIKGHHENLIVLNKENESLHKEIKRIRSEYVRK